MNKEILELKQQFREKWPFEKVAEIKRILKVEGKLNVMEYLCDELMLECEIAKLARGYNANMIPGPLLGSGCKKVYPWGQEAEVDHIATCGAELAMGDDFGDNECTFRCTLSAGHIGSHEETGNLYGKYPYRLQWTGDMLEKDDCMFVDNEDWEAFERFCERENISYETGDEEDQVDEGATVWMKRRYIRQFQLELEKPRTKWRRL